MIFILNIGMYEHFLTKKKIEISNREKPLNRIIEDYFIYLSTNIITHVSRVQ